MDKFNSIMKNQKYTYFNILSYLMITMLLSINGKGEGSRELNSSTHPNARRIYLSQAFTQWYKITLLDSIESQNNFYVYANIGDSICMASSALGIFGSAGVPPPAFGAIGLRRPDGSVAGFWNSAPLGVGRIQDGGGSKARELEGPFGLHNGGIGGYTPVVFVADQAGIYIVNFSSPKPTSGAAASANISVNANFTQNNSSNCIASFDISIVKTGALIPGRVYANYLSLSSGSAASQQYFDLPVLTREGYNYLVSFRALQPYGYFIYADNVGMQLADGVTPAYESRLYGGALPNNRRIMVPDIDPETAYETKHKIFFNNPDPTMPATAILNTNPVWLNPLLSTSTYYVTVNYTNTGIPNPMAGNLSFNIPNFGVRYKLQLDLNNNNVFGEVTDVTINGSTNAGVNAVPWDGTDGSGAPMASGCFNVKLDFIAGELHVPLADAENFRGGIRIRRFNGNGVLPNDTIHWNDLPLSDNTETPLGSYIKKTPLSGVNSNFSLPIDTSIRRWEQTAGATIRGSHSFGYGDLRYMDQWAFDTLSTNVFTPLACFSVLSVKLKSFEARLQSDESVSISWSLTEPLASENYFNIERSIDSRNFSVIQQIFGESGKTSFQTTDKPLQEGNIYYRVKWINEGGQLSYSQIRKVNTSAEPGLIKIYPNPTSEFVNVNWKNSDKPYTVKLADITGKELFSKKVNVAIKIDLKSYPSGTYFLSVTDINGNRQIERIQISRR